MRDDDDFGIEGTIRMNDEETECLIEISSASGEPLTAQLIIDHVAEMLFTYYGISKEEWAKIDLDDEDGDTGLQ